jgi:hypothetical protein
MYKRDLNRARKARLKHVNPNLDDDWDRKIAFMEDMIDAAIGRETEEYQRLRDKGLFLAPNTSG